MKKLVTLSLLALSLFAWSALAGAMTGIITDAKCKHRDTSAKSIECAKDCIKAGEKTVFIDDTDNKVYTIANPAKVEDHIGHRVTVTGEIEGETLTVDSVKMAAKQD